MASLPLQSLAEYRRFVAETLQHPCVLHSTVRVWSDMHNTSDVLFRLCANTDPQRDSIFTKGPADVLDHATSEIAVASKLGIDGMKVLPDEGFKRAWPPLIKMDESVKAKVENILSEGYHERHQAKLERWLSRRGICFHSGSLQKPRAGANPFLRNRSARRSAAERSEVRREAR